MNQSESFVDVFRRWYDCQSNIDSKFLNYSGNVQYDKIKETPAQSGCFLVNHIHSQSESFVDVFRPWYDCQSNIDSKFLNYSGNVQYDKIKETPAECGCFLVNHIHSLSKNFDFTAEKLR